MPQDTELSTLALERFEALEMVVKVLAEALEEIRPGLAARTISEIRNWETHDTTVAMVSQSQRDATVAIFGNVFRLPSHPPVP